jgi:hypothetical protein
MPGDGALHHNRETPKMSSQLQFTEKRVYEQAHLTIYYVPKDRTFCQSMPLTSRVCLAVGIDSVGHVEY